MQDSRTIQSTQPKSHHLSRTSWRQIAHRSVIQRAPEHSCQQRLSSYNAWTHGHNIVLLAGCQRISHLESTACDFFLLFCERAGFFRMLRTDPLRHLMYGASSRRCGAFTAECPADQGHSFLGGVSVFKTQDASQRDVVFETSANALPHVHHYASSLVQTSGLRRSEPTVIVATMTKRKHLKCRLFSYS